MKGEPLLGIEPVATPDTARARGLVPMAITVGLLSLAATGAIAVRNSGADGAAPAPANVIQTETDLDASSTNVELATTGAELTGELASTSEAPIELTSLDGSRLQIPSGEPTVVYFMSTTGCVACEIGAFELQDLYVEGHQVDVIALEVIPDVPLEWMADYKRQLRLDYPVVADPDGAVSIRYDVADLSIAIVLDPSGRKVAGPFDPADRAALDAALATIEVQRDPQAETADSQPVKLLP